MRRLPSLVILFLLAALSAAPLRAGPGTAVIEALRLTEVVSIMRAEGIAHGVGVGESMLGPRGSGPGWQAIVEGIHDRDRMLGMLRKGIDSALPDQMAAIAPALDFFEGELGRRILRLEISAREAMLDTEVDEAAREGWARLQQTEAARAAQLLRLAEAGDLIEENVVGGLNSTFAFYRGLMDSGASGFGMGQQDMLADVWSQEPEIRAEIEAWLFGYLGLAYGPLGTDDLDDYVALFESEAGQQLNAALFAAFNAMFETLSHDLGLAAGRMLAGEDL